MGRFVDAFKAAFSTSPRIPEGTQIEPYREPRTVRFSAYTPVDVTIQAIMQGLGRVGRAEALGVPAVLRGRNLICSVGTLPLEAVDAENRIQDHPLLRQIDNNVPNVVTLAMTIEDLLFESVSWWRITAFGWDGYPVSAVRYAPDQVSMTPPTNYRHGLLPSGLPTEPSQDNAVIRGPYVWMGGEPVPFDQVIRFDCPNPPFLVAGQRAIKRAIALDKAADLYAGSPKMRGYFTPKENQDPGTDEDIIEMLDDFATARRDRLDGYVPAAVEYNTIQDPTPAEMQLVQMQQRADLAIANALGIDPEDLGINTTSRTYQNAVDRRKDRVNDVYAPYMKAITDRLGMPDVTKRGVTVRFNQNDYLKADPKTRAEVQQIYVDMGVKDTGDIQQEEGIPEKAIQAPKPMRSAVPPTQISAIPQGAQ